MNIEKDIKVVTIGKEKNFAVYISFLSDSIAFRIIEEIKQPIRIAMHIRA